MKTAQDRVEENRRKHEIAVLKGIEASANRWLDLAKKQDVSTLDEAEEKEKERLRRHLTALAIELRLTFHPDATFVDVAHQLQAYSVAAQKEKKT